MRILIIVFSIIFLSCSHNNKETRKPYLVFQYSDFGPQVIANELIGMEWPSWQTHGDSKPAKSNVNVVVYSDINLTKLKQLLPKNEEKGIDYRYVTKTQATHYLDEKIAENVLPSLTFELSKTLEKIDTYFSKP